MASPKDVPFQVVCLKFAYMTLNVVNDNCILETPVVGIDQCPRRVS